MSIAKGLITAGIVALNTVFGSKAIAQDCDKSWFDLDKVLAALVPKPVDTWNMDLIASAGPENVTALITAVNSTLKETLDREVKNIFDGIEDSVKNNREIDWTYYKDSYNPIFTPDLEKAEADIKGGAEAGVVLPASRIQGTLTVSRHIMAITEKLATLDTSNQQCLFVVPDRQVKAAPTASP